MRMKKLFLIFLASLLVLLSAAAGAEVSPSPSVSGGSGLIVYRDTGETVVRIQMRLRELGYLHFKPTGNFQTMSQNATIKYQQRQLDPGGQPIIADGTVGPQSMALLFKPDATRDEIVAGIPVGPPLSGTPTIKGEAADWREVKTLLQAGDVYTVTDYNTGKQFSLTFAGGENHAEMECTDALDTVALKSVFGNAFSFFKRPVVIKIDGRNIAASLQGHPHGADSVSGNDMDGHLCLYFYGSVSHVSNLRDAEHDALVDKATGGS